MDLAKIILGAPKEEASEYDSVADEIMSGFKEGKRDLVVKGLKAFIQMCEAEPEGESSGEE